MAMKVPKKENMSTDPKFLKNGFFCILYPLSKIIGGSSNIINKLTKCLVIFWRVDSMLIRRRKYPAHIPIIVVNPASYKYLCPDFFK